MNMSHEIRTAERTVDFEIAGLCIDRRRRRYSSKLCKVTMKCCTAIADILTFEDRSRNIGNLCSRMGHQPDDVRFGNNSSVCGWPSWVGVQIVREASEKQIYHAYRQKPALGTSGIQFYDECPKFTIRQYYLGSEISMRKSLFLRKRHGTGIPCEKLPHVSERFVKLKQEKN